MVPDTIPVIASPAPLAHSWQGTVLGSQRWPDYGDPRRPSYTRPIIRTMSTNMNASQHRNPSLIPNLNSNPGSYQAEQESSPSAQTFPNFGASVYPHSHSHSHSHSHPHPHPYPHLPLSVNGANHPFDRLATPETISHSPAIPRDTGLSGQTLNPI
jgi:hypothetical protein